jgi:hypothetical protein
MHTLHHLTKKFLLSETAQTDKLPKNFFTRNSHAQNDKYLILVSGVLLWNKEGKEAFSLHDYHMLWTNELCDVAWDTVMCNTTGSCCQNTCVLFNLDSTFYAYLHIRVW